MSTGEHNVWQWNPPMIKAFRRATDDSHKPVQSATECTGLMQTVPDTQNEVDSISGLYAIHAVKPQGNVGKDNPNNPPSEIDFHRH